MRGEERGAFSLTRKERATRLAKTCHTPAVPGSPSCLPSTSALRASATPGKLRPSQKRLPLNVDRTFLQTTATRILVRQTSQASQTKTAASISKRGEGRTLDGWSAPHLRAPAPDSPLTPLSPHRPHLRPPHGCAQLFPSLMVHAMTGQWGKRGQRRAVSLAPPSSETDTSAGACPTPFPIGKRGLNLSVWREPDFQLMRRPYVCGGPMTGPLTSGSSDGRRHIAISPHRDRAVV